MLNNLCYVFLMFLIYSFLGYIVEVINCSIIEKRLVLNRGFCLGPYLPIYGICCLFMGGFIVKYHNDFFTVFVMSAVVCTIIEYLTSYILEKIFKARWWDYSNRKFNLEGRVCLINSFYFGLGGVVFTYILNPIVLHFLDSLSPLVLKILGISLFIIFLADLVITVKTMVEVKISTLKFKNKDITTEIRKLIRTELTKKRQVKDNFFVRHMLRAFPNIDLGDKSNSLAKLKNYLINSKKRNKL